MAVSDILDVVLADKKGYLTLSVTFRKEGKIMLRSSSGIQRWFSLLKEMSGVAGQEQQSTAEFWSGKFPLTSDTHNVDSWLLQRHCLGQSVGCTGSPWYKYHACSQLHLNNFHTQKCQPTHCIEMYGRYW